MLRFRRIPFNALAKAGDVHHHRIVVVGTESPHPLVQLLLIENAIRILAKKQQQLEHLRRTRDNFPLHNQLSGELVPGAVSPLTLTVRRDGRAVTDLQPYLGAYGHLVALRTGDLAYLHVHPDGSPTAGPEIRFAAEVPGAGTYRLYLDFRHGDVVRTAEFTVPTTGAATAAPRPAHEDDGAGH